MKEADLKAITDITIRYFRNPTLPAHYYEEAAQKDNEFISLMLLVNKPDRLVWLELIKPYLTNIEFTKLFRLIWVVVEFPSFSGVKIPTLLKWFKEADQSVLMDEEEKKIYSSLPDPVIAYRGIRGCSNLSVNPLKGISWSLSEKTAEFFYNRFNTDGYGYMCKATIPKKYVLAYFNDRNEKELIIDSRYVWNSHRKALRGETGNKIILYKPQGKKD